MNILKHAVHQPFVAATGVAALLHSTWSLGTLFSGEQPAPDFTSFASAVHFIGWIVPAFLIAFALDVGQIATSAEIAAGKRNWRKYATFTVFAVATYYLQWLYMAHHMPLLEMAAGIRDDWEPMVTFIRDFAIWFIPSLLPLSTLLYTLSQQDEQPRADDQPRPVHIVTTPAADVPALATISAPLLTEVISEPQVMSVQAKVVIDCPACDWSKEYETEAKANSGLRMHQQRYCVKTKLPMAGNGAHE